MRLRVSCPRCYEHLGLADDLPEARQVVRVHLRDCEVLK